MRRKKNAGAEPRGGLATSTIARMDLSVTYCGTIGYMIYFDGRPPGTGGIPRAAEAAPVTHTVFGKRSPRWRCYGIPSRRDQRAFVTLPLVAPVRYGIGGPLALRALPEGFGAGRATTVMTREPDSPGGSLSQGLRLKRHGPGLCGRTYRTRL